MKQISLSHAFPMPMDFTRSITYCDDDSSMHSSGVYSPAYRSLTKLVRVKSCSPEDEDFIKKFDYNVPNKQQVQDLFRKLLKYGEAYQTLIKSSLDKSENTVLSNFTAQLFDIQNQAKEMKEKAQKDIYDLKRNEEIAKFQKDIELMRDESSKTESNIRKLHNSQAQLKEKMQLMKEEYNFIYDQLNSLRYYQVDAKESNQALKSKLETLKNGSKENDDKCTLPPINQTAKSDDDDYFKEIYTRHLDTIEHLEKKLTNHKKINQLPQKRYKKVRDLIPYEQLFEIAVDSCKTKIRNRKSECNLSTESKNKTTIQDRISRTDQLYAC